MILFTDCCSCSNFFYIRVNVFPLRGYNTDSERQTHAYLICKHFVTKTCPSFQIARSSINFPWFTLFSQQTWWRNFVYSWIILFVLSPFWSASNEIFYQNTIHFAINQLVSFLKIIPLYWMNDFCMDQKDFKNKLVKYFYYQYSSTSTCCYPTESYTNKVNITFSAIEFKKG